MKNMSFKVMNQWEEQRPENAFCELNDTVHGEGSCTDTCWKINQFQYQEK